MPSARAEALQWPRPRADVLKAGADFIAGAGQRRLQCAAALVSSENGDLLAHDKGVTRSNLAKPVRARVALGPRVATARMRRRSCNRALEHL